MVKATMVNVRVHNRDDEEDTSSEEESIFEVSRPPRHRQPRSDEFERGRAQGFERGRARAFTNRRARQARQSANTSVPALFSMLDMMDIFGTAVEDAELEAALRESAESYQTNERKNIKLKVGCQRYDTTATEETTCSICSEDFKGEEMVSVLDCKHVFHEKCIAEWGKFKPECALCREPIEHTEVRTYLAR